MMEEEWRDIVHGGLYQVSRNGLIRNAKGKVLCTFINWQGYKRIYLSLYSKNEKVHRLVAMAFIDRVEGKERVNHKNGIKTDNRAENLEWCNDKENCKHALEYGLLNPAKGDQLPQTKLLHCQVKVIKSLIKQLTDLEISKYFMVSRSTIYDIRLNKTWKHI